jgi:hypothetical protein
LFAQTFSGRVVDEGKEGVAFANAVLVSLPDSGFVGGTAANEVGEFVLEVGGKANKYLLKITALGYEPFSQAFDKGQKVGDIVLKAGVVQMEEVSVVAVRPKIRMEKGRYIADIENSLAAIGNTIEALLNQLPGVWVSNSGIVVNGKDVVVYVDNIQIDLTGEQLMQYLRTLRSEEISKIEIIPQATAEFSAEGSGGVLRIITKRVVEKGWQGRIGSTVSYSYEVAITPQVAFQYSGNKLGVRCVMSINEEKDQGYSHTRTQDKSSGIVYDRENESTDFLRSLAPTITMNYDFNHYHRLVFSGYASKYDYDAATYQDVKVFKGSSTDTIGYTHNDYTSRQDAYTYIGSVNYDWLLDSLGRQKITWIVRYLRQPKYNQDERFIYENSDSTGKSEPKEEFLHEQDRPNTRYYVEVQYAHDFGKGGSGLAGIKYGYTRAENESNDYESTDKGWIPREGFDYKYQYKEQSVASFYRYDLSGKGWSLNVGLRGEYAGRKANGVSVYEDWNLFPSLNVNYTIKEDHDLHFSFNKRINYIGYYLLIPLKYYTSRYSITQGNSGLKPNILYNVSLNYGLLGKYYFSASYSWSDNALSDYNYSDSTILEGYPVIVSTWMDSIKRQSFNMNAYIPITFTSWWSNVNQGNIYWNGYQAEGIRNISNFKYGFFTQHDFNLPFGVKSQVLYKYNSGGKSSAYVETGSYHHLSVFLQKSFLKDESMRFKLEANNFLFNRRTETVKTGQTLTHSVYKSYPTFQLTFSYTINKGKVKKLRQVQDSEE